jgi:tRNA wybutosine-synthesizing protein 2
MHEAFLDSAKKLSGLDNAALMAIYPRRFECHGHVCVVKLNENVSFEDFLPFAPAFASVQPPVQKTLAVDVVLVDTGGIEGELREPVHKIAWVGPEPLKFGSAAVAKVLRSAQDIPKTLAEKFETFAQSPTFTTHVENGILYSFDAMRVMFCSGNTTERMHFFTVAARGETIVDMFAGIGYFTIPLAKHSEGCTVHALEKNPVSAGYLEFNLLQNKVADRVVVHCGDNRTVTGTALDGKCDRVLMGYIPSCASFLPRACQFLRHRNDGKPKGILHYHFLAAKEGRSDTVAYKKAYGDVIRELGEDFAGLFNICQLRMVKSFAPHQWHYVADIVFGG